MWCVRNRVLLFLSSGDWSKNSYITVQVYDPQIRENMKFLPFLSWLTSLSIMFSSFIHFPESFIFTYCWIEFHSAKVTHFCYPFISWLISRLTLLPSYCKLGSNLSPYWIVIFQRNMNISSSYKPLGDCITFNVHSMNNIKEL